MGTSALAQNSGGTAAPLTGNSERTVSDLTEDDLLWRANLAGRVARGAYAVMGTSVGTAVMKRETSIVSM
jgi:cyanophycinase-like exopeptidase